MASKPFRLLVAALVALGLLTSCAVLNPNIDPPKINVVSVRSLAGDGRLPRFEIVLRVLNPNEQELSISGISYSVVLLDREVVSGVSNNIAPIKGYGESLVALTAELQFLQLLQLMASLGINPAEPLVYRLTAKIDFYGFMPTQRFEERGDITLR